MSLRHLPDINLIINLARMRSGQFHASSQMRRVHCIVEGGSEGPRSETSMDANTFRWCIRMCENACQVRNERERKNDLANGGGRILP
eukprot:scaffold12318_cov151-Amphora_coffeaeformis.AAC.7